MPHVCGDEPEATAMLDPVGRRETVEVCPTYVGMNRAGRACNRLGDCMPHVCGDEPEKMMIGGVRRMYAPRMWG